MPAALHEVIAYADELLQPGTFQDFDRAWNGLQVENRGEVQKIAATVDASLATIDLTIRSGANLLIVHHGLFWGETRPWTGRRYLLMRRVLEKDIAVYSQHLPLDGHPRLGNAAQMAFAMGWRELQPFFFRSGSPLGVQVSLTEPILRDQLAHQLSLCLGKSPIVLPGGAEPCQRIGICTGGAGAELAQALAEGVDTFITGEGPHWTYALAEDLGLNVFHGGHYATETFGVKALAAELSQKFAVPWEFIDHPTGL